MRPAASVRSTVASGCVPTRLWGNPSHNVRPPLGIATQCHGSPDCSDPAIAMASPNLRRQRAFDPVRVEVAALALAGVRRRRQLQLDAVALAQVTLERRSRLGGSSLQVSAESASSSPKSSAARRAIGTIRSHTTASGGDDLERDEHRDEAQRVLLCQGQRAAHARH